MVPSYEFKKSSTLNRCSAWALDSECPHGLGSLLQDATCTTQPCKDLENAERFINRNENYLQSYPPITQVHILMYSVFKHTYIPNWHHTGYAIFYHLFTNHYILNKFPCSGILFEIPFIIGSATVHLRAIP